MINNKAKGRKFKKKMSKIALKQTCFKEIKKFLKKEQKL